MLFKDTITKEKLLKYYVKNQTNALYKQGIQELKDKCFEIMAFVCDGRKWFLQSFENIPIQMCQFLQKQIVVRYLTKKPKLQAGQELMKVIDLLTKTDKESFERALGLQYNKWKDFLNGRNANSLINKTFYVYKKLRNAYRSLKNNFPQFFSWYDNNKLNMPNITNVIDGHFAGLKK